MNNETSSKVTQDHLKRTAYLYVRQSTIRQVIENTESTKRQYALKQRAIVAGWTEGQIQVIDTDLGQSGATSDRVGFQKLVAEVGLGKAGMVMGLEVSRLARNSADWHHLLEICALTRTLILDEEGIYDPSHFNDRLLLGLKGTMSEAELYVIRARLRGGMLNKAKRGELKIRPPVGFIYDSQNRFRLDPDKQIQESVRLLFNTFRRVGSACATVKEFNKSKISFPKRMFSGPQKGEIIYSELTYSRVFQVLRNPRYAGAYVYGRRQGSRTTLDRAPSIKFTPREQWQSFIKNAHDGYISWGEFEEIEKRLVENTNCGPDKRKCPPREGPALLQSLVVCGICGATMSVRYHYRRGYLSPDYCCQGSGKVRGLKLCQSIPGDLIDDAIGQLLIESMTPTILEVALSIQNEIQSRLEEADKLRYRQVERAKYEAELSRRRYMAVDPNNRLVADELEADWNRCLKHYREAAEEYKRLQEADSQLITEEQKKKVMALVTDFPRIWDNEKTPYREKKRMMRLLIENVTLTKKDEVTAAVLFKGGFQKVLTLPLMKASWEEWITPPEVVSEINKLLDEHTDGEVATLLNKRGLLSGMKKSFDGRRVAKIRRAYQLKSRYTRLKNSGLLTTQEICQMFELDRSTVIRWRTAGKIKGYLVNDGGRRLYEIPKQCNNMNKRGAV